MPNMFHDTSCIYNHYPGPAILSASHSDSPDGSTSRHHSRICRITFTMHNSFFISCAQCTFRFFYPLVAHHRALATHRHFLITRLLRPVSPPIWDTVHCLYVQRHQRANNRMDRLSFLSKKIIIVYTRESSVRPNAHCYQRRTIWISIWPN